MEAGLAIGAAFFGGMFVTAAALWFHERRNCRTLEEVSARVHRNEARTHALLGESRDVLALIGRDGNAGLVQVGPPLTRRPGGHGVQRAFDGVATASPELLAAQ